MSLSDLKILDSWQKNAKPWVTAVRQGEIESRLLVTNEAIVNAVLSWQPRVVLDVGCGEGWLSRALAVKGVKSLGVDAVPELIQAAKSLGGRFRVLPYEELSLETVNETFDVVACNFSLLGKESVDSVFSQVPSLLNTDGAFIMQTIHPLVACGDAEYEDGWREGSWCGFNKQFSNPAPWYFRTIASWQLLFAEHGFNLIKTLVPENPTNQKPVSIIFMATLAKSV